MRKWNPYSNNRLVYEHPDGFYIIKPKDAVNTVPLFCPICETIMLSFYDEGSFKKFECCDSCANYCVYPNMEKWKSGWRPTKQDIESKLAAK